MSFYAGHRYGGDDRDPPLESLVDLVAELDEDPDDPEHVSVHVVHESDWGISAYISGVVVLENVEETDAEPRHMTVDRRRAVELLTMVAQGRLEEVFAEPWQPGYGGPGPVELTREAVEIIHGGPEGDCGPAASEALVEEAQRRLGLAFPPSFRSYLLACGAASHAGQEIYGLVGDLDLPSVPNLVWVNELARRDRALPAEWLILQELDDSSAMALRLDGSEEPAVFQIRPGERDDNLVQREVAISFGHYLRYVVLLR